MSLFRSYKFKGVITGFNRLHGREWVTVAKSGPQYRTGQFCVPAGMNLEDIEAGDGFELTMTFTKKGRR